MTGRCPLCQNLKTDFFWGDLSRVFYRCTHCDLVFLDRALRWDARQEKAHYQNHLNSRADQGYVSFLNRLKDPLTPFLLKGAHGLDVGCGPQPVLSQLFAEMGFTCDNYDPFFFPNEAVWEHKYDFITASEVIEHVYEPAQTFVRWLSVLRGGSYLAMMTDFRRPDASQFASWPYRQDLTHVCFWSSQTCEFVTQEFHLQIVTQSSNVIIFRS